MSDNSLSKAPNDQTTNDQGNGSSQRGVGIPGRGRHVALPMRNSNRSNLAAGTEQNNNARAGINDSIFAPGNSRNSAVQSDITSNPAASLSLVTRGATATQANSGGRSGNNSSFPGAQMNMSTGKSKGGARKYVLELYENIPISTSQGEVKVDLSNVGSKAIQGIKRSRDGFSTTGIVPGTNKKLDCHFGTNATANSWMNKRMKMDPNAEVSVFALQGLPSSLKGVLGAAAHRRRGRISTLPTTTEQPTTASQGNVDGGKGENACGNCGKPGHQLANCVGPVTRDRGDIRGCPFCNTKSHTYDACCKGYEERNGTKVTLEDHFQYLVRQRPGLPMIRTDMVPIWLLVLGFEEQGITLNNPNGKPQGYPLSESEVRRMSADKNHVLHIENVKQITYTDGVWVSDLEDPRTKNLQAISSNTMFLVPSNVGKGYVKHNLLEEDFISDDSLDEALKKMSGSSLTFDEVAKLLERSKSREQRESKKIKWAVQRIIDNYIEDFATKSASWASTFF
ncbi:uncharacterized protein CTRU02_204980 [Colletotrichum truncatum]|uniref:Uncharacterized protein n=1 Tax=Colletotrichum truncatum TaxID=5467 RepID=A0ACC3Z312_COLTU|nr:uncharacterized protein CTRU02_06189 [Colletotrichum truncatum]KAF6793317.1 hypothetical protein CTRU02_06189 [Colletotrichum truncatum]